MTGEALVCALLGGALLIYPARAGAGRRLHAMFGPARPVRDQRFPTARLLPGVFATSVGALPAVLAGWPHGVPIGLAVTGVCWWAAARSLRTKPPAATVSDRLRLAASWDLLAACLRAGLPVPSAVRSIANDLPAGAADGLRASAELITLGADPERAWAPAMAYPDTAPLARGARRAARSGTALAEVATGLAEKVRAETNDAAEARAQRAGVLITGPLGLCFLPAFLCLGVIPVIVGLASGLAMPW